MAKKQKGTKARKADPLALRRITLKNVRESEGVTKVYGVARKLLDKDTPFGVAHGIKGTFEVQNGDGKIRTTKQAFLGDEVQGPLVDALAANEGQPIMFGVSMEKNANAEISVEFFHEPSLTDPLRSLRETATAA